MARTRCSMGVEETLQQTILRQCPVTGGRPTRITKENFDVQCWAQQDNAGKTLKGTISKRKRYWCDECQGKQIPPEVEFITKQQLLAEMEAAKEQQPMAKSNSVCELCGQEKKLDRNHGKMVCASCMVLQAACVNRPQVVVQAMTDAGADNLLAGVVGVDTYQVKQQRGGLQAFFAQLTDLLDITARPERAPEMVMGEVTSMIEGGKKRMEELGLAQEALCAITRELWPLFDVTSLDFACCMDNVVEGVKGAMRGLEYTEEQLATIRAALGLFDGEPVEIILSAIAAAAQAVAKVRDISEHTMGEVASLESGESLVGLQQAKELEGKIEHGGNFEPTPMMRLMAKDVRIKSLEMDLAKLERDTGGNDFNLNVIKEQGERIKELEKSLKNAGEVRASLPPEECALPELEVGGGCGCGVHIERVNIYFGGA